MNNQIAKRALEILEDYPIHYELPVSLSGKYHIGETAREHLQLAVNIMNHLCDEFDIVGSDRDLLIASTWLHDIGLYEISVKGKKEGWKYYEKTGYSKCTANMLLHPIIGASIIEQYKIPRKEEVKRLVSVHMSHWYQNCPQPINLFDNLICIADYVASRGKSILEYKRNKQ